MTIHFFLFWRNNFKTLARPRSGTPVDKRSQRQTTLLFNFESSQGLHAAGLLLGCREKVLMPVWDLEQQIKSAVTLLCPGCQTLSSKFLKKLCTSESGYSFCQPPAFLLQIKSSSSGSNWILFHAKLSIFYGFVKPSAKFKRNEKKKSFQRFFKGDVREIG